jgi:hypothetical protein
MFRNVVNDFLRYGLRSISGMSRKMLHPREAQRAFNYLRSGQNSAFLGMVVREGIAYSRRTGRPFSRNKVDWAFMGWEGWKKAFDRARARANRTRNWSSTEEEENLGAARFWSSTVSDPIQSLYLDYDIAQSISWQWSPYALIARGYQFLLPILTLSLGMAID